MTKAPKQAEEPKPRTVGQKHARLAKIKRTIVLLEAEAVQLRTEIMQELEQ